MTSVQIEYTNIDTLTENNIQKPFTEDKKDTPLKKLHIKEPIYPIFNGLNETPVGVAQV